MTQISGTLRWDTSVADNHGWLLDSAALLDGASCLPSPDYYSTEEDAPEEQLQDLIISTLRWEGYTDIHSLTMEAHADGFTYTWSAEVHRRA